MEKPKDELAALRQLLSSLEAGETTIHRNGVDITKKEAILIRREIDYLDLVIKRAKNA